VQGCSKQLVRLRQLTLLWQPNCQTCSKAERQMVFEMASELAGFTENLSVHGQTMCCQSSPASVLRKVTAGQELSEIGSSM